MVKESKELQIGRSTKQFFTMTKIPFRFTSPTMILLAVSTTREGGYQSTVKLRKK